MNYTDEQIEKINEAFLIVSEFKNVLEDSKKHNIQIITGDALIEYENYINEFNIKMPGILNLFDPKNYIYNDSPEPRHRSYRIDSLLIRVIKDYGILKTKKTTEEKLSVTPYKDFSFVNNSSLKTIIERDYDYLNKCLIVQAWKPVIILAGGLIEALLLDKLSTDETKARASSKAPNEKDLKKWDLDKLIDVAVDLQIINPGVEKLSDAVRHYRNLVHPGKELTSGLKIEPQEAKVAVNILDMVIRDLEKP